MNHSLIKKLKLSKKLFCLNTSVHGVDRKQFIDLNTSSYRVNYLIIKVLPSPNSNLHIEGVGMKKAIINNVATRAILGMKQY